MALALSCQTENCEAPVVCKGFCNPCYQRQHRAKHRDRYAAYDRDRAASRAPKLREGRKKWRDQNPERAKHCARISVLKRKYGLTEEAFQAMFASQKGLCAICLTEELPGISSHVDHCHVTGIVRGLLCESCNRAIGIMKDDPARLRAAADYIERSR